MSPSTEAERPSTADFTAPQVKLSAEVASALRNNTPVVALESTIIAHGMPYPQNLHTAQALEQTVRANGATPATVAVIHGIPHVGLTAAHLNLLSAPTSTIRKLARRDLPLAYARREHGATTVSATMEISHAAGVRVFATGGIGGVHRGVAHTWDISADLATLAAIPQLVVCAGAKSLLDLPKTLEALESASVPVLVLRHHAFPAFYTRGHLPAPARVETEAEAARVFYVAHATRCSNGVLLAVPVPEQYEADAVLVEHAIKSAVRELDRLQPPVLPAQVTPFLLRRVAELTKGASLTANMHLARNNAAVAARVAVELCKLQAASPVKLPSPLAPCMPQCDRIGSNKGVEVLVVGGVALDVLCDARCGARLQLGVSNGGRIRQCAGGVGKNVAEAAARSGAARVALVSAVGDDAAGTAVMRWLQDSALDVSGVKTYAGRRTAACCIVHDEKGDLAVAIGDMDDIFNSTSISIVSQSKAEICSVLRSAKIACLDGNISAADMKALTTLCVQHDVPCWFEPTTPQKSVRIVQAGALQHVKYVSPNETELHALARALDGAQKLGSVAELAERVLRHGGGGAGGQRLLVTRGARGVSRFVLQRTGEEWEVVETVFPAVPVDQVRNTTGAGDWFAGRCIAALAKGVAEDDAVRLGLQAAAECCLVEEAVSCDATAKL